MIAAACHSGGMTPRRALAALAALALLVGCGPAPVEPGPEPTQPPAPTQADVYKRWPNGPNPTGDPGYWPIGVWLQNPDRTLAGQTSAQTYTGLGIDMGVMVNAWPGCAWCESMEDELATRTGPPAPWRAGMWAGGGWKATTFPGVERLAARPALGPAVTMWGLDDEADMRRWDPKDESAYPTNYRAYGDRVRAADPSRPVYSNFGKGMAVPGWNGYHAESPGGTGTYGGDMAQFCASSDIVSVDFYGYTDPWEQASQRGAWTYGRAIDSARKNCGDKPVWGFVEGAHPWQESAADAPGSTITPAQMEAAAWNVAAHGANGLIWFAHHFDKTGTTYEDGMLRLPANRAKAGEVSKALKAIAPVLNATPIEGEVSVASADGVPVTFQHKRAGDDYIVAVADGNERLPLSGTTTATFTVPIERGLAEVVGESRTVPIAGGKLIDQFGPYGHHVYRLTGR